MDAGSGTVDADRFDTAAEDLTTAAEAFACRAAQGNSVQKKPWLTLSTRRFSALKLNVKVAVAIGSVRENGIPKSAELLFAVRSIGNAPQTPFDEMIAAAVRFERW